jgi:hypothetical protein
VRPQGPQREQAAPDLHEHVGGREREAPRLEGFGKGRREDQARQHQDEHHEPDGRFLRVEPVGDPGGVDPYPPDGHEQQRRLQDPDKGEVLQQGMRELRYGEDENQVEEQFDEGHPTVLVLSSCAK